MRRYLWLAAVGVCALAAHAEEPADALADRLVEEGKSCERVSCLGQCDRAPATLDESLELVSYEGRPPGITPDDPELMEDLLVAAVNEAAKRVDEEVERLTQGMASGLNIPGMP